MLLGTTGACLSGYLSTSNGTHRACEEYKSIVKWNLNLMMYGAFLGKNLPKMKDWAYVINHDEYKSIETY